MSRFVGLREEQREAEVLMTLIFASLPLQPRWCHREQARSHSGLGCDRKSWGETNPVGASLLAKGAGQPT